MKLFKTKSVLFVFVTMPTNTTIIKINTFNIINIERIQTKVPLFNLKTSKFSPAKSIPLQFLSLNTKLLINKFLPQKTEGSFFTTCVKCMVTFDLVQKRMINIFQKVAFFEKCVQIQSKI